MKIFLSISITAAFIFCQSPQDRNLKHASLTASTNIVFADSNLAAKIVSTEDDFLKVVSAWDRSSSMQSSTPVSRETYIEHLAKNVIEWPDSEVHKISTFSKKVGPRLEELNLNLPKDIIMIKTTSNEIGGARTAYTRQNAIMITAPMIENTPDSVVYKMFIHEIAHVYSRHNKIKREELYNIFGFKQTNEIDLPQEWDDRRLSNPDAPDLNTIIDVEIEGKPTTLTPLIYSRAPVYDESKPGGIFQSFGFQLMQVEKKENIWQPVFFDGNPVLHNPSPKTLPDFWKQIGKNTNYIMHPEEIMASNFVFLVNKKTGLPNPEILKKMEAIVKN
ncbi:MAG: hypothetical protein D8M58_05420 [Calditrichaeota bacterium]|nr:MAG: hypothetical protein DWQ03_21085 [Calditrichota bacterium]MBL1204815.1 hypothetical protein [Calditrichota bacterium]NOG44644.1 hypothetical protein [Calditrichota bacterium]